MSTPCDPCNGSTPVPAACNCPPSPIPPWHRPTQSFSVQTITGADTISLTQDTTYLTQATPGPYALVLPNGSYQRQIKRIYIPSGSIIGSATFNVTGAFSGFTSLTFNAASTAAVLEWDGAGWQLIGGDVVKNA